MKALVLLPLEFEGRRYEQDEVIELAPNAATLLRAELCARAKQGVVRMLDDDRPTEHRDMHPAPATRGYKKRA
jgi:hypothetical protein